MIDRNSDFPLMNSAVHVTVHDIIHASGFVHTDDLDVVFSVVLAAVNSLVTAETEHLCKRIFHRIVAPEFSLLHERHTGSRLIRLVFNVRFADSKLDILIVNAVIFSAENLVHGALEIQQIDAACGVAHPVIFFYIIVFDLTALVDTGYHIIKHDHVVGRCDLLDRWNRLCQTLSLKIRPAHLL